MNEDRFILLGLSIRLRVVVVCHGYRENEDVIRIISARKATAAERNEYMSQTLPSIRPDRTRQDK